MANTSKLGYYSSLNLSKQEIQLEKAFFKEQNIEKIFVSFKKLILHIHRSENKTDEVVVRSITSIGRCRCQVRARILALTESEAKLIISDCEGFTPSTQVFISIFIEKNITWQEMYSKLANEIIETDGLWLETLIKEYTNYESANFGFAEVLDVKSHWGFYHENYHDIRFCSDSFYLQNLLEAKKFG